MVQPGGREIQGGADAVVVLVRVVEAVDQDLQKQVDISFCAKRNEETKKGALSAALVVAPAPETAHSFPAILINVSVSSGSSLRPYFLSSA